MNDDLVSIIMPSYNCGEFVEETIRSVQAQTYQNWEIIFIDDSSTDDTIRIVSSLREKDERIHLYQNVHNSGAAVSRNNALREAKGKWIAFLDSDDLWEPTKLEKQVRFMEDNGYMFSYTGYQEIDSESRPTGVIVSGPKHITKRGMYSFCWPGCLTVMYDASRIGFIQIEDIKKNNDYAMWLKVCKKSDCYLLDECLAKYRRGRVGSVSSQSIMTMIGWHYKLWHEAEGKGSISSLWHTGVNLVYGFYKKLKYVNKGEAK
jgi:glycosyltransferase involved in cell wall biosynthesis